MSKINIFGGKDIVLKDLKQETPDGTTIIKVVVPKRIYESNATDETLKSELDLETSLAVYIVELINKRKNRTK